MLIVLRVLVILAAVAIGLNVLAFLVTGERRRLHSAWRITRWSIVLAAIFFGLMVVERILSPQL
ncbi:MAG: hypothetical protein HY778_02315 [Betaproteobacteria bacterium]|nr:hypothetical protein [Betaproteobacteria bacterium]